MQLCLLVMLRRRERIDSQRERQREREGWKTHGDAIDRVNTANGGLRRRWREAMVRRRDEVEGGSEDERRMGGKQDD